MRCLCILLMLCSVLPLLGDDSMAKVMAILRQYEVRPMEKPDWASQTEQPLFKVAWISDMHLGAEGSIERTEAACRVIREKLKPDFTIVTGDNSGVYKELSAKEMKLPEATRRHLWCRYFLDEQHIGRYEIIPGDNWPLNFEKVFGSYCRSFDCRGFHFIMASADMFGHKEGACVFSKETYEWLAEDAEKNKHTPTLFIMHHPSVPPFFMDAPKVRQLYKANGNFIALLSGHVHMDLDFSINGIRQLIGPSTGRSHRPAFKHMLFYSRLIIIESYEWDENSKSFAKAEKWQRIDVPDKFRKSIEKQKNAKLFTNYAKMPLNSMKQDATLDARLDEMGADQLQFIFSFGMERFMKK